MPHSFTLHDLPVEERPRERLKKFGEDALSTQELIQIILGQGVKGESVSVLSQKLITKFGNLEKLSEASLNELYEIKGIGPAKAAKLKAVFEIVRRVTNNQNNTAQLKEFSSPELVAKIIRGRLKDFKKEHFYIICLDSRNKSIGEFEVSVGTLNASLVHPREIFAEAIKNRAAAIILVHNHPSGSTEPSDADLEITKKLVDAGELLDIHVLDHVIVTKTNHFSFKSNNLI